MKKIIKVFPELFFMVLGIYWVIENYLSSKTINYIALLIIWLLLVQLIYKNKVAGLVYGISLGFMSFYMILAVLSEYHKYEVVNAEAIGLLASYGSLFCFAVFIAGVMVFKYATTQKNYNESVLTITY